MIIDPGHDLDLRTVREEDPAHHVHLPQVHRPRPFPAPVVLPPAPPLADLDQAMAHQRPVDRRPARQRHHRGPFQLPQDPRRTPPRMLPPHRHDPRLDLRGHLMRARRRPRRPVRQPAQALLGIPAQPPVHRLPHHPVPASHLRDRDALLEHLQHRPVPLLHRTQLHQHTRLPPPRPLMDAAKRPKRRKARNQDGVSPSNPDYCRPATGTASANCRLGTRTEMSSIYRDHTQRVTAS